MNRINLKALCTRATQLAFAASITFTSAAYAQELHARLDLTERVTAAVVSTTADPYAQGVARRAAGDAKGAFQAFHQAALDGHAQAQRRLGEIYDAGNTVISRDLMESIRWYQMARQQGEHIAQPNRRSYGPVNRM